MKIGFACKFYPSVEDSHKLSKNYWDYNIKTVKKHDNLQLFEEKIWNTVLHNLTVTENLLMEIAKLPPQLRMIRLSSELLPFYSYPTVGLYQDGFNRSFIESRLKTIGELIRNNGIKVSFHPGQFCCLASTTDTTIENSIAEIEYHAYMAYHLGFARKKLDMKINIHVSGKGGIPKFRNTLKKLSPEAKLCLTVENDEIVNSLSDVMLLGNEVGIVLDTHHHWCKSGEHIRADDWRIEAIKDSWGDNRPTIHYSQPNVEHCYVDENGLPQKKGYFVKDIRQHTQYLYNKKQNKIVLEHLEWADIMVEAKAKNLASFELYEQFKGQL